MNKYERTIHLVVVAIAIPTVVYGGLSFSNPVRRSKEYALYSHYLSDGSIFIPSFLTQSKGGELHKVDNSDAQFSSFRNNVPSLLLLASIFLACRRLLSSLNRSILPLVLGLLFVFHGLSSFKILVIAALNFHLSTALAKYRNKNRDSTILFLRPFVNHPKIIIWIFNIFFLFSNSIYNGYPLGRLIHPSLSFIDNSDILNGVLPHWTTHYNISMLRLLSFSLDYIDRDKNQNKVKNDDDKEKNDSKNRKTGAKDIIETQDYTFSTYLIYVFYTPLYIAGPIMTFNAFSSQLHNPSPLPRKDLVLYVLRFVGCFFTMELILHNIYAVAIKAAGPQVWSNFTPFELSMFGFWSLIIVWLKLLLPWRFFRMWALLDGLVDPPENMIRCMANNYSTLGFWRAWHVSFNKWTVKYIYVPLGGNTRPLLLTLVVFTFVAVWHDLSFQLLAWGWIISLFVLPEVIAKKVLPEDKYGKKDWYIHVCALGGVFNILLMMMGNLVGFVVGLDGLKTVINDIFMNNNNSAFPLPIVVLLTFLTLFSATHVMMEYRQFELSRGIKRRC